MSEERRVAAVTGGAGYIGAAIVRALEAGGYDVAVLDRAGDFAVDLEREAEVRAIARRVLDRFGRCDTLVHAAAAFDQAALADVDVATWRRVMAVNVEAAVWLCQVLTPSMAERGFGRVVFVVSDTVWDPPPVSGLLPYIASKGALIGAARSLARSLGTAGITVNCVAPGLTPPPGGNGTEAGFIDEVRRRQALPRELVPDDVAQVVAFLAADAAQGLSGQTLCPDGGLVFR